MGSDGGKMSKWTGSARILRIFGLIVLANVLMFGLFGCEYVEVEKIKVGVDKVWADPAWIKTSDDKDDFSVLFPGPDDYMEVYMIVKAEGFEKRLPDEGNWEVNGWKKVDYSCNFPIKAEQKKYYVTVEMYDYDLEGSNDFLGYSTFTYNKEDELKSMDTGGPHRIGFEATIGTTLVTELKGG